MLKKKIYEAISKMEIDVTDLESCRYERDPYCVGYPCLLVRVALNMTTMNIGKPKKSNSWNILKRTVYAIILICLIMRQSVILRPDA